VHLDDLDGCHVVSGEMSLILVVEVQVIGLGWMHTPPLDGGHTVPSDGMTAEGFAGERCAEMKLDAMLCNYAETVNNLLYLSGGGVNTTEVPSGTPPYVVNLGFGLIVTVPPGEVGKSHELYIELVDEHGQAIALPRAEGIAKPLRVVINFTVEAKVAEAEDDEHAVALAANLQGLPLPEPGRYEFVLSIRGRELCRLGFRVRATPFAAETGTSALR